MRKRTLRISAALLTVGLLAAACGSDRGDSTTPATGSTAATAASGTGATGTGSSGTGASGTGSTGTTGEKFGDLASPCGAGTAKGATDKGVTDTSITIGYGDDAGYAAAPGLNKEMSDSMKAMIDWCNGLGGINGRKVEGKYYDAKLLEVKNAMTQACTDKVFMLVGQGWALDAAQEDIRIGCQLSTIPTYSVSTAFAHGPGMRQSAPNPGDELPLGFAYQVAGLYPDSIKKTALVYANYSATLETKAKVVAAFPAAGYSFLNCDQVYNIGGEADWKPFVNNLKACGAEVVYWVGSPAPNFENFLTAAKQVGFAPKAYMTDANHYDSSFAKWNGENGGAADNVYVRLSYVPFEEADKSPATKKYLDLVTKAGGKTGLLGAQAAASFLLWSTAVKACGSTVTAKCVIAEIDKLKDWTAGGLQAPMQPAKNEAPTCSLLVKLTGAKFERVLPKDKTFDCDAKYLATNLKTEYVAAAKLDGNRVATAFGTYTP
jgi:ABC-type branched-subunit amino acid transport system substrate-binding protein